MNAPFAVLPAKAGIRNQGRRRALPGILAVAGVTDLRCLDVR